MTMNLPDPPAYDVVPASGGLDSTTLACHLRNMGPKTRLLPVTMGSGTPGSRSAPGRSQAISRFPMTSRTCGRPAACCAAAR